MFQISETFVHEAGFRITPISMGGEGFIFLPQELEDTLGYEDLPKTVRESESFAEGIEYMILRNVQLKQLKELLKHSTELQPSLSRLYESIKFAPTIVVLTECGLYTIMVLSRKEHALSFRRWVTGEVLPSIRKSGIYINPGSSADLHSSLLTSIVERLDKIELTISELKSPVQDSAKLEKANSIVENMAHWYELSPEQKKQYFTTLCREYQICLPEKALIAEEPVFKDLADIAKDLGLYSLNGKPHANLVGAIWKRWKNALISRKV